ncbi:PEP-CTERM sorting domain-containing protein [Adhaeretor mobilis]|uniref:PEP-CTERM protein-sorting domain-containing protein n=1 Tax=Adhaeretor mobilis TaxID=1930276 RepID=A0A517MRZ3_9BACT|nr:PEP-CTERM sorting domain-containing protein [Adhaeretor mobilis]QDS97646.1 hypothetical protein HG15A2_09100 [Adhaeretor mobilis]
MKRGLVLSLCAAAVVAMSAPAMAAVDASLNLRYSDPANPADGGEWQLVVQSDSGASNGVSGIQALITGASGVTGIDTGSVTGNAAVWDNTGDTVFRFQPITGGAEVAAGDALSGTLLTGVGTGGASAGNIANDVLLNPTWDNSALIASGTFGATRPTFTLAANEFDSGAAVAATVNPVVVRGDSLNTLDLEDGSVSGSKGLLLGDSNRNGTIDAPDFSAVIGNFGGVFGWDGGNFSGAANGTVGAEDFSAVIGGFGNSQTPVSVAAVPEPSTIVLCLMSSVAACGVRRKRG